MITHSKKIHLLIAKVALTLVFSLAMLASYAQSRFTYGLEVGASRFNLTASATGSSVGFLSFEQDRNGSEGLSPQVGGYLRYHPASWLFAQSGLSYLHTDASLPLTLVSEGGVFFPSNHGGMTNAEHLAANYRFHQLEVPLLLGVSLFRWLRVYAGPSWTLSLNTSVATGTSADYSYRHDPVLSNLRVGVGGSLRRFSLDVFWQSTTKNDSYFQARKSLPDPVLPTEANVFYRDFRFDRVAVMIGYRLR